MILEWIEGDQAVEVDEDLYMLPTISPFHLPPHHLVFITLMYINSIPDGYDTSQMILEWIEGEEAVEMDENLQMPQFVFSKDPQPEGCIKRYKTGGFSNPCSFPCFLLPCSQLPAPLLSAP